MSTSTARPMYWDKTTPRYPLYEALYNLLVPLQGDAPTFSGQALRYVSNFYYDVWNNGGGNLPDSRREDCEFLITNFPAQAAFLSEGLRLWDEAQKEWENREYNEDEEVFPEANDFDFYAYFKQHTADCDALVDSVLDRVVAEQAALNSRSLVDVLATAVSPGIVCISFDGMKVAERLHLFKLVALPLLESLNRVYLQARHASESLPELSEEVIAQLHTIRLMYIACLGSPTYSLFKE